LSDYDASKNALNRRADAPKALAVPAEGFCQQRPIGVAERQRGVVAEGDIFRL